MPCETIRDANGNVTFILCGRRRHQPCKFCHERAVEKLCDYPVAKGKTCDAGMCAACATNIAPELDYCPTHKHQAPPPQRNLFGE
jgi:hypothetical protein